MTGIRYRPEVDGLRAVAVLPVILFHAGVPPFTGGFIGVDVFFVISGYLITSIVLSESDAGAFSLWNFYDRRLRRILPALLTVVALTAVAGAILMTPGQLKELGQSIVAALAFSANIFFWLKLDYWSQSSELIPLLHLWSLGVEEQFYLLTPLIALVARRRTVLLGLFAGLAVASFAAMLFMHQAGHVAAAFYLLPFRAWEIAVGAVAALVQGRIRPAGLRDDMVSGAALAALLACVVLLDERSAPALMFGLPVLCTVVLILFCREGVTQKLLAARPMVLIGLISYSLYLFHQPVLALMRIASPRPLEPLQIVAAIALTFALAGVTYRFIESPCRKRPARRIAPLHYALAGSLAALFLAGLIVHRTDGLRDQKLAMMDPALQSALLSLEEERASRTELWKARLAHDRRPFEQADAVKVLIVGDSLSEDLFVAATTGEATGLDIRRLPLDDECIRTDGRSGKGKEAPTCRAELDGFLGSSLLRDADVVVFANAWLTNADAIGKVFDYPAMHGKQVVVYETHGFLDMLSVTMSLDRFGLDPNSDDLQRFLYLNRHQRTLTANAALQQISERRRAATIKAFDFFCDPGAQRCRLFTPEGRPMVIDQAHLSESGLKMFRPWLKRELSRSIVAPHRVAESSPG